MKYLFNTIIIAFIMAFPGASGAEAQQTLPYPVTRTVDQTDTYHGTTVADPYRWLENDTAKETADWVTAQNRVTNDYLNKIPHRAPLRKRLKTLFGYPRYSAPFREGGKYFFFKNTGLQNQSVLYMQESLQGKPVTLLDPNKFSADGTVALSTYAVSDNAQYLAYGVSESGSDWQRFHVRDVSTKKDLSDELNWVKFSGISWTLDNAGFFYSRFPQPPDSKSVFKQSNIDQKLYYHKLGTPQSEDRLVYERTGDPDWFVAGSVTEDGRYLLIYTAPAGPKNLMYYIDLVDSANPNLDGPVTPLIDTLEASYNFIGNDGTTFYFQTDLDAPRGKVVAVDITKPRGRRTIIPQSEDVIDGVSLVGDQFIVTFMHDAHSAVKFFDMRGKFVKDLPLPTIGSVGGVGGKRYDTEFFYGFTSFLYPTTILRYDVATGTSTVFHGPQFVFDPTNYETKQVFCTSRDGTRVPLFITHRKGIKLDGTNPTLLYGYGGFGISLTPFYNPGIIPWMENGGVYVIANLRGGGEYGEQWHQAGTKLRKQNVFDDFIASAEFLFKQDYTSPGKLVLQGGSNGGLLVGAVMCQRPDLCAVALPDVGVMDMLRYQEFTIGSAWKEDYGLSTDPAEFKALYAYSPLHNLKPGVTYPATMVTTADHDDRVFPAHSFKFAARLQACQAKGVPALIRIESKAGHGGGKPISKYIEEIADELGFAMANLGMAVPK